MKKAQHTPGPWSYEMRHDTNYAHITCDTRGGDNLQGYCGEPNARLIAAAPALLEALQNMLGLTESSDYMARGEIEQQARAAIAKALGEKLP